MNRVWLGMPALTFFEFFAGGGMARLGLGEGWRCAFANEWCPKKARSYRANFAGSSELLVEDIAKVSIDDLPGGPDLCWGSFPCQDLSLAGSRRGLAGERSGTFASFWRLMLDLAADGRKPPLIVLENVVGAITSNGGSDFRQLAAAFEDAGYRFGPLVIDAVRFVPQSRPRLFVVAFDAAKPIPKRLETDPGSLLGKFEPDENWVSWRLPEPPQRENSLQQLLERQPWNSLAKTQNLLEMMSPVNRQKVAEAQLRGSRAIGAIYRRTRTENGARVQRAEVRFDDLSGCLRTPAGGSSRQTIIEVCGDQIRTRLLSAREAARLMGLPDSYQLPPSYNEAYHLAGDGVVVPVVSWLERHLLRPLAVAASATRIPSSAALTMPPA